MRGGKLYLKKGIVVDVSQPTVCDVHFPDLGETVQVSECAGGGQGRLGPSPPLFHFFIFSTPLFFFIFFVCFSTPLLIQGAPRLM